MKNKSLATILLDTLEKENGGDFKNSATYRVFFCLFKILPENELESLLQFVFKQRKKSYWFAEFHKSMRQTDFYSNCFSHTSSPTIDKKEECELNLLTKNLVRAHKIMEKIEKTQSLTTHEYLDKMKEIFPHEKRFRRSELLKKLRHEVHNSINGYMDSILYNMIHADTENLLYQVLERTFNEYAFLNRRKGKLVNS
jgi:hypothetical protein